jgi:hypothetical protein
VAEDELVEQAADELYGLPPGEFTRARDARAKELRKENREAADAIKGLRKPSVAAWALNQLGRRRSKELERLVAAGEELRAAQEELLAGGDRAAFQEATARERELVAELSAYTAALASEAGQSGSGLQEKVAETLHAAALEPETAAELRSGRLVREREAIGGFEATGMAAPPATKAPPKPPSKKNKAGSKPDRARASREAERREQLAAARTDERHARRELEAAAKALARAEQRAEAAAAHAAEAAERARTTAERLKESKRAEAAARKAHSRAERELEGAERAHSRKP